jgi:hypothetical protein
VWHHVWQDLQAEIGVLGMVVERRFELHDAVALINEEVRYAIDEYV